MGPEVYYSTLGTSGFLRLFEELGCNIKHLQYDQYPELHTYLIVQKQSKFSKVNWESIARQLVGDTIAEIKVRIV